jgi:hypothetical protein
LLVNYRYSNTLCLQAPLIQRFYLTLIIP